MPLKTKVTQMIMPDFRKWQEANQESPQDLTKVNAEVADAIDKYDFEASHSLAENVKETKQTLARRKICKRQRLKTKPITGRFRYY